MTFTKRPEQPQTMPLYGKMIPARHEQMPTLTYYPAKARRSDAAIVIFPGGAYAFRANHEGEGYALMLNGMGVDAFVCDYRVSPNNFPAPLLDARRAIRTVRECAPTLGIDPQKIAVMGSSAGGHLAALSSTYKAPLAEEKTDDTDNISARPDLQILCYPVIFSDPLIAHLGSYHNLTGTEDDALFRTLDPGLLVDDQTPPAFMWHTAEDCSVPVANTLRYAELLTARHIPCEIHIFPHGSHGLGCAENIPHVAQWTKLLENFLGDISWLS